MAENLQVLKKRIKTSKNIAQIAKAMEMIAASKIKKAQKAVENNKPYSEKITKVVEKLLFDVNTKELSNPFLEKNTSTKKLLIVISPDKGLCGGLTSNLFKKFSEYSPMNTYLITVGKKVESMAAKFGFNIIASFHKGSFFPKYSFIYPIIDLIKEYYLKEEVSEVHILFSEFKSIMVQNPVLYTLLPIEEKEQEEINDLVYTFEPQPATIINELLPYYLEVKLYDTIIESFTSEQAARMIAMQNAKDNALDIMDSLHLHYNRLRQENITNELLDLSNGQIA